MINDQLLAFTTPNEIKLWDMLTNKCIRTLDDAKRNYHLSCQSCLELSKAGNLIVGIDNGRVKMFNVKTPYECLVDFKANEGGSRVTCIRTLPHSGKHLTSSFGDNKIKLWSNLDDLQINCEQTFNSEFTRQIVLIPTHDNRFLSRDWKDSVKLWNLITG